VKKEESQRVKGTPMPAFCLFLFVYNDIYLEIGLFQNNLFVRTLFDPSENGGTSFSVFSQIGLKSIWARTKAGARSARSSLEWVFI
jgi:hypothetical protein